MGADGRNVTSISQSRNISAFVPAWSTVFRESIIELGSVAPSSVVNPEDAVQIIGGRPVIGSERIRRHARRKVREPRPPQRLLYFPSFSRHKCLSHQLNFFDRCEEQAFQPATPTFLSSHIWLWLRRSVGRAILPAAAFRRPSRTRRESSHAAGVSTFFRLRQDQLVALAVLPPVSC